VKKEICDRLISECEQSFQKMGLDFYEIMKRAPERVERWKKYYGFAQEVWSSAGSHEQLTAALLAGPDPDPAEFEVWLAFIRTFPHFLRGSLQGIASLQIGNLYGQGVALPNAQKRMAQRYGVGLRTIQRAWQERAKWKPTSE
jgi:hypothetical protein